MPPAVRESIDVVQAKSVRSAEIAADTNDLKANSTHPIDAVRRAARDAYADLAAEYDDPDDVRAIELPSERLEDADEDDEGEEAPDEPAADEPEGGDEEPADDDEVDEE